MWSLGAMQQKAKPVCPLLCVSLSLDPSSGCCNKEPQTGELKTVEMYSPSSEGQNSKTEMSTDPHSLWRLQGCMLPVSGG